MGIFAALAVTTSVAGPSDLPPLTPESLFEIKILLTLAAILSVAVLFPHFLSWSLERRTRNRMLRMAMQFYCHRCRRGTDWSEDRTRCLECPEEQKV